MNNINDVLIDNITSYGITIINDEIHLVINNIVIKLVDNEKYLNYERSI